MCNSNHGLFHTLAIGSIAKIGSTFVKRTGAQTIMKYTKNGQAFFVDRMRRFPFEVKSARIEPSHPRYNELLSTYNEIVKEAV